MNKQEFLTRLKQELAGLPKEDIEERLAFYEEMIDDRIEEGVSEEEAVLAMGDIEEIVSRIIADIPFLKIAKKRIKPDRKMQRWEIVLLILGSPIWLSLLIAAFAIVLSIYVSIWSIVISLWSVFASLIGGVLGGIGAGIVFMCTNNVYSGLIMIAGGLVCVGLAILMFYGCVATTKGLAIATKKIAIWIKNLFIKKEEA